MNDPRFEPLPLDQDNGLIERLVRDLVWAVWNNVWRNRFNLTGNPDWADLELYASQNPDLEEYLSQVWGNRPPNLGLAVERGYLKEIPGASLDGDTSGYMLTDKALKGR